MAARVTIVPQQPLGPYPTLQPTALALDVTWTAADASNFNQFAGNSPKILLIYNSHASIGYTFTLTSKVDARNRTGDVTTYAQAAGIVSMFAFDNYEGWLQADGFVYIAGSNAAVKFAVINK